MKLRYILGIIAIIFICIIQSTLLAHVAIGPAKIKPNILLIAIIIFSFYNGYAKGAVCGLIAGFAQDLTTGMYFGLYTILGVALGAGIGFINKKIYKENIVFMTLFVFLGTFAYETIAGIIINFRNMNFEIFVYSIKFIVFPEAIYNFVISIAGYYIAWIIRKWSKGVKADGMA